MLAGCLVSSGAWQKVWPGRAAGVRGEAVGCVPWGDRAEHRQLPGERRASPWHGPLCQQQFIAGPKCRCRSHLRTRSLGKRTRRLVELRSLQRLGNSEGSHFSVRGLGFLPMRAIFLSSCEMQFWPYSGKRNHPAPARLRSSRREASEGLPSAVYFCILSIIKCVKKELSPLRRDFYSP